MTDLDKYKLVVLESLLKEFDRDRDVCLFGVAEETVCLEVIDDDTYLVFDYERGSNHNVKIVPNVDQAVMEIIDRVTDSYEMQDEFVLRYNEVLKIEKGKKL